MANKRIDGYVTIVESALASCGVGLILPDIYMVIVNYSSVFVKTGMKKTLEIFNKLLEKGIVWDFDSCDFL